MSAMEIDSLWHSAFGESTRPALYTSQELNEDGFQPLTDPHAFIMDLSKLSHQQLYAASANSQVAMKLAQDEYVDLERQINKIKGKETLKNPQSLPAPDVFEERKESVLYGYKYDGNRPALLHATIPLLRSADDLTEREKHDVRFFQEPFQQAGFVPREREYKARMAKARDPKNPDDWRPVIRNGKALIPKQQVHNNEYNINYVKRNIDENGEVVRPPSAGSEISGETPSKAVDKRLTRTRFDGKKFPPTRDVSESPSVASTPGRKRASPSGNDGREDTPNSKRRKVGPSVSAQDRPKHPNQYTKARELAALNAAAVSAAATSGPNTTPSKQPWQGLSIEALRNRKWTDEELVESVKQDHLWLHDDPNQAEDWKHKIINGINPVRSFSMFRKWAYWKAENKDKRPRAKKNLPDGENKESEEAKESPKPRRAAANRKIAEDHSEKTTPAPSPQVTPGPDTVNGGARQDTNAKPRTNTRGRVIIRRAPVGSTFMPPGYRGIGGSRNTPSTEAEAGSRTDDEVSQQVERGIRDRSARRPSLKREESDSMIVVNGTPSTGTRRSLRVSRRASG